MDPVRTPTDPTAATEHHAAAMEMLDVVLTALPQAVLPDGTFDPEVHTRVVEHLQLARTMVLSMPFDPQTDRATHRLRALALRIATVREAVTAAELLAGVGGGGVEPVRRGARVTWVEHVAGTARSVQDAMDACRFVEDLPPGLRSELPGWFDTHLPGYLPDEWVRTVNHMHRQGILAAAIGRYLQRRSSAPTDPYVSLVAATANAIAATPGLAQRFTVQYLMTQLTGKVGVLDERAFNKRHVDQQLEQSANRVAAPVAMWFGETHLAVAELDGTLGFTYGNRINLREEGVTTSTCVHESMHLLSSLRTRSAWRDRLGPFLEEAAAEYLCRLVCAGSHIVDPKPYYEPQVQVLTALMAAGLTLPTVLDGYFDGKIEPVRAAIVALSGATGLAVLLDDSGRRAHETLAAWRTQFAAAGAIRTGTATPRATAGR
ncbi:hypothetical protein OHA72_43095 [Dactylosporangium sp. NBC_01737]|uniref:hypothetical protein n=1 Tax=Dactylosporangium sp. NBC_01737 TaxID=2975959 RepID=UPI002E151BD2|nr:hypothetical protein OHA72_43095 [Dactylosporangium sp. NBC_01737]